ncbi:Alpha/beta hydrolase-like protein 3 [Elsinoe fawcettii]|nr:Alpha/beta hydrolase-like protein 3 [Elsinoe fawcettii]
MVLSLALLLSGTAFAGGLAVAWYLRQGHSSGPPQDDLDVDALSTDPGLLKKHSKNKSYTVHGITYPSVRTFYHPHSQADKLPTKPTPLPLLVFIHGLGGSVAQFSGLLTNLVNVGPCLAIDLPGCGLSDFQPQAWEAYKFEQLTSLIATAIEEHRDHEANQKIVLIGHSLGCSFAILIASKVSPLSFSVSKHVIGMIAICPRAEALHTRQKSNLKLVPYVPVMLFDGFRMLDRKGGVNSASVERFVGKDADEQTRRLQLRFNEQSRSPVFLRFVAGFSGEVSIPGPDVWSKISVPLFCIAGEDDKVTPANNIDLITNQLREHRGTLGNHQIQDAVTLSAAAGQSTVTAVPESASFKPPPFVFKTAVLPAPAGHGLMYAQSTVRVVSGLVQGFLASHIDQRLSIGWQLQHLTTEGKWDVKNLEKWQRIQPVSEPIANIFRAMKTLREVDEEHTPKVFAKEWSVKAGIPRCVAMVCDISHDSPVYDPKGLEEGGIEYHKFPTVSKLPPTVDEVRSFISLIDSLRTKLKESNTDGVIAVHCHYGFNRTGFFIIAYLVERLGSRLQDALELFAETRPPGIRHDHFVNELHVRYAVGLKRAPTWN